MPRKRQMGYGTITVGGVVVHEQDNVLCGHCNAIIPTLPGQTDTDSCRVCDSHICPACATVLVRTLKCVSFDERMDIAERADAMRRMRGGLA